LEDEEVGDGSNVIAVAKHHKRSKHNFNTTFDNAKEFKVISGNKVCAKFKFKPTAAAKNNENAAHMRLQILKKKKRRNIASINDNLLVHQSDERTISIESDDDQEEQ